MKKSGLRCTAVFFLICSPLSLCAQLGLYGAFTAENVGSGNSDGYDFYGGTLGAYLASGRLALLSAGVDLRGSSTRRGGSSFDSGLIGPRLGLNTHILPIHPYLEGLAGAGHVDLAGSAPTNATRFAYQLLGGLDYTVLPRIDWRVAEFSYGGLSVLNHTGLHPKSLSTGIVIRLPRLLPIP